MPCQIERRSAIYYEWPEVEFKTRVFQKLCAVLPIILWHPKDNVDIKMLGQIYCLEIHALDRPSKDRPQWVGWLWCASRLDSVWPIPKSNISLYAIVQTIAAQVQGNQICSEIFWRRGGYYFERRSFHIQLLTVLPESICRTAVPETLPLIHLKPCRTLSFPRFRRKDFPLWNREALLTGRREPSNEGLTALVVSKDLMGRFVQGWRRGIWLMLDGIVIAALPCLKWWENTVLGRMRVSGTGYNIEYHFFLKLSPLSTLPHISVVEGQLGHYFLFQGRNQKKHRLTFQCGRRPGFADHPYIHLASLRWFNWTFFCIPKVRLCRHRLPLLTSCFQSVSSSLTQKVPVLPQHNAFHCFGKGT